MNYKTIILTTIIAMALTFNAHAQKRDASWMSYEAIGEIKQTCINPENYCFLAPNPMVTEAYLCFNSFVSESYELTIRTERGQKLFSVVGKAEYGDNKVKLSRNNLPAGKYNYIFKTSRGKTKTGILFIVD